MLFLLAKNIYRTTAHSYNWDWKLLMCTNIGRFCHNTSWLQFHLHLKHFWSILYSSPHPFLPSGLHVSQVQWSLATCLFTAKCNFSLILMTHSGRVSIETPFWLTITTSLHSSTLTCEDTKSMIAIIIVVLQNSWQLYNMWHCIYDRINIQKDTKNKTVLANSYRQPAAVAQ